MADIPAIDRRAVSHELTQEIMGLVLKVAIIIFTIEALIMVVLSGFDLNEKVIIEGLIDSTSLTLISSPLIYLWVARPFAQSARDARQKLTSQLQETRNLLDQNEALRLALQASNENTADTHERILQKIGAELHDGPAQLLSFTLLKLDRLGSTITRLGDEKGQAELAKLREALTQTMREVRDVSTGLSLPELGAATMAQTIQLAVSRHEEFTGTKVGLELSGLPETATLSQKSCAYRFVQEALSNSFKHARATTRRVVAKGSHDLTIAVIDDGCGFVPNTAAVGSGLGLPGMRARIQSLGGRFLINSTPHGGTTLTATIPSRSAVEVRHDA